MSDFGTCHECADPALVKLNGVPLCLAHYDAALRSMREKFDELGLFDG